nr:MAG TPA: hypothetical protein [Caudoviricetes sp.]
MLLIYYLALLYCTHRNKQPFRKQTARSYICQDGDSTKR